MSLIGDRVPLAKPIMTVEIMHQGLFSIQGFGCVNRRAAAHLNQVHEVL